VTLAGPGRRALRRGFGRTVDALLPARGARTALGVLLAVGAAALGAAAAYSDPMLWPYRG
jgi:hypothetical protein